MKFKNRRRWGIVRDYVVGWTIAFLILSVVRGAGTIEQGAVQFEFPVTMYISMVFGVLFGVISGYAQIWTEERLYRRVSIQKLLLLRLSIAVLFVFTIILVAYAMVRVLFAIEINLIPFIFEPGSFAIYSYIVGVDTFMFTLRQVNLFLGENNLWKFLMGKFYTPREEERIFMFLDLQSSTQHAEQLGHIRYSMMIQDCFNDLGVVVENEAEIYQYVGDEVILTWKLKNGIRNQNCLNAYYNFKGQLLKKESYYQEKYQRLPFFKAGMHSGIVTVTEVGKYKREIAYHGDTINTAARIQGKCNELGAELLISEELKNQLEADHFSYDALGHIPLKGKAQDVLVHAVQENSSKTTFKS